MLLNVVHTCFQKRRDAHFHVHTFILGYYLNSIKCFNTQQMHQSEMLCSSSCLLKAATRNTQSALIGRLTQAWASTANAVSQAPRKSPRL